MPLDGRQSTDRTDDKRSSVDPEFFPHVPPRWRLGRYEPGKIDAVEQYIDSFFRHPRLVHELSPPGLGDTRESRADRQSQAREQPLPAAERFARF